MIEKLPLQKDLETKVILKQVALSERALGELKGVIQKVPNESVLISTLFLQEAKASSEVENIVTTHDEIFRSSLEEVSPNAKEVQRYNRALLEGFKIISSKKLLLNSHIKKIQNIIEENRYGFRNQMGTKLKNNSGKIIYTPPQNIKEIENLMGNLEKFINNDGISDLNPLIKMAIIHHQFESIHPFYDGNGRTGRIINILYLSLKNLLDTPVLYLSRYIIDNKSDYYTLLQKVRDTSSWEEWILFMLKGVESTAKNTTTLIGKIIELMKKYKNEIRSSDPNMYSQDLINVLFSHPYTKINFLSKEINCSRQTASVYLNKLSEKNLLVKEKIKNSNYYINQKLCDLFLNIRNLKY